jgi:3-keto-5-aminohexanoate cleavage enzyme
VFAGDFIEATAELVRIGATSRQMRFEAKKVATNLRQPGAAPSAADVLAEPLLVCRATGTCVTPKELQRRPKELYMPALPPGPAPQTEAVVTPPERTSAPASEGSVRGHEQGVVLTAAIVSAETRRAQTPQAPAREIADEAARCREAGAAVVHLHVRNRDGTPSQSRELFGEAIAAIRAKTDCIIQLSTGGAVRMSIEQRAEPLAHKPEMATLHCGSVNVGDDVFVSTRPQIRELAKYIRAAGSVPELECYEVGHVEEAILLEREGALEAPLHFQFVLGVPGGIGATPQNVRFLRTLVPSGATWAVAAVGKHQQPMTELAMSLGGHARVGLEDNVYLSTGVLSEGSAPLVARAAAYARSIGRVPVEPSAARRLLGVS